MSYQIVLMYFCTAASACWLGLGYLYGVPEAYYCAGLFAVLSFLYWDQDDGGHT